MVGGRVFVRIVVTGGAGFIGSHIVEAFLAEGHEVLVLDSLWQHGGGRRSHVPDGAGFVQLDILSDEVTNVFADFKPRIVCHHAGQHSVAISNRDPSYDARVNVLGLLNVLEASVKAGAGKLLFASSAAIFGNPERLPITEDSPQLPTSPYGITKMVSEHYLRFFKAERGLDFTALRYGNVYGPRQDPNGEAGVIAAFIGKFLGRQGVRIDWDGEQTRDYIYVGDIARANVKAVAPGCSELYQIGTGIRTSVNDIYRVLVKVTGFDAPVAHAPPRTGDVRHSQFDVTRAGRELGWKPEVDLIEGLRRTVAYFRDTEKDDATAPVSVHSQ